MTDPRRCPICGVDVKLAQTQPGGMLAAKPSALPPGHVPARDELCPACRRVVG